MILSGARADVEMVSGSCREVVRGIPEQVLIGVHLEQLLLQGSLHLNRSRALAQLGQQPEAAQELSVTMALWAAHGAAGRSMGQEATEQLIKAHYHPAAAAGARAGGPPERLGAWPRAGDRGAAAAGGARGGRHGEGEAAEQQEAGQGDRQAGGYGDGRWLDALG